MIEACTVELATAHLLERLHLQKCGKEGLFKLNTAAKPSRVLTSTKMSKSKSLQKYSYLNLNQIPPSKLSLFKLGATQRNHGQVAKWSFKVNDGDIGTMG
jgi:hypothetical protein